MGMTFDDVIHQPGLCCSIHSMQNRKHTDEKHKIHRKPHKPPHHVQTPHRLNAAEMYVDVETRPNGGTNTQWIAESGMLQLYLLLGPTPLDVSGQYAWLTGSSAMPNMFSIGYHQCRWNYKDEEDVRTVNAGFDQHGISYDVIWLDIEHTDGKRWVWGVVGLNVTWCMRACGVCMPVQWCM